MRVTKPLDLVLLAQELTESGVSFNGLGTTGVLDNDGDPTGESEVYTFTEDGLAQELTQAAQAIVNKHDAQKAITAREQAEAKRQTEDAARLKLVQDKAKTDPAFAALAELVLGRKLG